jgi:hypothetical protein
MRFGAGCKLEEVVLKSGSMADCYLSITALRHTNGHRLPAHRSYDVPGVSWRVGVSPAMRADALAELGPLGTDMLRKQRTVRVARGKGREGAGRGKVNSPGCGGELADGFACSGVRPSSSVSHWQPA